MEIWGASFRAEATVAWFCPSSGGKKPKKEVPTGTPRFHRLRCRSVTVTERGIRMVKTGLFSSFLKAQLRGMHVDKVVRRCGRQRLYGCMFRIGGNQWVQWPPTTTAVLIFHQRCPSMTFPVTWVVLLGSVLDHGLRQNHGLQSKNVWLVVSCILDFEPGIMITNCDCNILGIRESHKSYDKRNPAVSYKTMHHECIIYESSTKSQI